MIYAIYPLMVIILFWGAKPHGFKKWNEEAFSLRQMKALQGYFAICIMLHHVGQKTCASWLDEGMIIPGLELFVPFGYFFVGFFFFCSGYGLYVSHHAKPDYLKGFGRRRILPIILAFYSTGLIFLLARYLMKEPLDQWKVLFYASGLMLSNPYSWYVIALPFFYVAFWLSFRHCKQEGRAIAFVFLFTFVYQLIGTIVDHNDWWMRGEWWYNSVHFFPLGLLFAKHREKIQAHLKKFYLLYFILFLAGIFLFYGFSEFAQAKFSYYGEYWHAPDKVLRRWICLFSQILASCSFVFFVFLLGMKVRLGNWFLDLMGTLTLEFYLIHGLFLELFSYSFADVAPSLVRVKNVPLLVIGVFLPSLSAAMLLQKFHHFLLPSKEKKATTLSNQSK